MRPLLKWVGGKHVLAPAIAEAWRKGEHDRLVEPFAGSAALFFYLQPRRAMLVDLCHPLIEFYQALYHALPKVLSYWKALLEVCPPSEVSYYAVRSRYNEGSFNTAVARAVQFLYLNRLSYQGLWRVNASDEMNAPYGHYPKPWLPDASHIREVAGVLRSAWIVHGDFEVAFAKLRRGDFVYVDPPYHASFGGYTKIGFSYEDQCRLARAARKALDDGATVVISNRDCAEIRELYPEQHWDRVEVGVVQRIAPQNGGKRPEMLLVGRA